MNNVNVTKAVISLYTLLFSSGPSGPPSPLLCLHVWDDGWLGVGSKDFVMNAFPHPTKFVLAYAPLGDHL